MRYREHKLRQTIISFAALCVTTLSASLVAAQDINIEASYTPDYFTQFQPITAQDMVERVPGFSIQDDSGGERGLGQADLNILINGRRPSSKSSNARDILGRIPVKNVERIDIVDGASLDIPGLSGQVANVITRGGKLSGRWEYAARFEDRTEPQLLEGELSVSGSRGNVEFVASLDIGQFTFSELGDEQFFNGNGALIEDRTEDIFFATERPSADLNLTFTPDNGHVAHLNLSTQLENLRNGVRETFVAGTPEGNTGASFADGGEDEFEIEIGGDYAFPLAGGNLKLIALHSYEDNESDNSFQIIPQMGAQFRSDFDRFDKEGETIGRAEYSWKPQNGIGDWQISWEGAFNYLDSTTELSNTFTDPIRDNVRVEEKRTEANITHSRALAPRIDIQASLGAEYSQLEVTTLDEPSRNFFRPKGFLSASYDVSDKHIWRAKVERGVGQLNFGTFVSSVNLTDETANTGNSQIVPTQFWNGEIELERKGGGAISGTAKVFARFIEDPIDRILFPDGSEGPGNLDSAWQYGVQGNMTYIFDDMGAKGLRLELSGGANDSAIDDPVTGQSRKINSTLNWFYDINVTHDFENSPWAYGIGIEQADQSTFFRRDQSFRTRFVGPENVVRLTHKDVLGVRLDVFFQNFVPFKTQRERLIFDGDRLGDLVRRETYSRQRGRRMGFKISDTF